ncbi:MAG: hypothetical protein WBG18_28680, partial [Xanthobacteraceae bacterium]
MDDGSFRRKADIVHRWREMGRSRMTHLCHSAISFVALHSVALRRLDLRYSSEVEWSQLLWCPTRASQATRYGKVLSKELIIERGFGIQLARG